MPDHRPIDVLVDEQRKTALIDRLQSLSALEGSLSGVSFITARDIEEVFDTELELDYEHRFTATTPAHGLIDMVCPSCKVVIPDVPLEISSIQTREEGSGTSKVKLKAKAEARVHVCGQLPFPKAPEVAGQDEMFSPDEVSALDQLKARVRSEPGPDAEDEAAEDEALDRLADLDPEADDDA